MAGTTTKKSILLAAVAWFCVLGTGAVSYKYIVAPMLRGKLLPETGIKTSDASKYPNPVIESDLEKMIVVDSVKIDPITFGRGKFELSDQSKRTLDEAYSQLQQYPKYFLFVIGNAKGDNKDEITNNIVIQRVNATVEYFVSLGFDKDRIIMIPSGSSGESQVVSFIVAKHPN